MKKYLQVLATLLVLSLLVCACGNGASTSTSISSESALPEDINDGEQDGNERLDVNHSAYIEAAMRLLSVCAKADENVCLSPLSVYTAMAMCAEGADGETKKQIEDTLFLGENTEDYGPYLSSLCSDLKRADSLWYNKGDGSGIKEAYVNRLQSVYQADVEAQVFDATTKDKINAYISKKTEGKIDSLLDDLDASTILCLIDVLSFEEKWDKPFDELATLESEFYALNGKTQTVPMMYGTESRYLSDDNTTGFIKPYESGYSFVALLPDESISLDAYMDTLSIDKWNTLMQTFTKETVHIGVPRFQSDYKKSLKATLIDMGIEDAFMPGKADFSAMLSEDVEKVFVDDVIHGTYIKVDEVGTEAAAATVVEIAKTSLMPMEEIGVILNRPFVYAIVEDESNLPIFIGTVTTVE